MASISSRLKPNGRLVTVIGWLLAIGIFILISGKVWIASGSGRNTQIYITLLLPTLFLIAKKYINRDFSFPREYFIWILFLTWVGLSSLWSTNTEADFWSLAKRGLFISLYLGAVYYLFHINQEFLWKSIFTAVITVFVGALATLLYQYGVLDIPLGYRSHRLQELGLGGYADYGWPVAAGIFHGSIALYALYLAIDKNTRPLISIIWGAVFTTLAIYVLLTYTRGAWIALAAGFIVLVLLQRSKKAWFALALSVFTACCLIVKFWSQLLIELQTRQLSGRGPIWQFFYEQMQGHWFLGHGLGTPFEYHWPKGGAISPHAHSLYLQQIYDSGIVSLTILSAGLTLLFIKAWSLRENRWVKLALPVLIFSLVAMITDVERIYTRPGDYWVVFWTPVALLLAVSGTSKVK
ncbi:O-antigen ligase family protein [Pseudomonas sp. S31]|nr:O-antigen ligase family protein [Pseudomonas sp. S31]